MPADERPREKLIARGAAALTDSELIAILLRTGVPGANAIEVARAVAEEIRFARRIESLHGEGNRDDSRDRSGQGGAAGRCFRSRPTTRARIVCRDKKSIRPNWFTIWSQRRCATLHKESLRVILLDTRYHLLRIEEVSIGSVNESIAHPREVFRPAIISSAYAVIVVHNHPSGDPSPSQADHSLTRRLSRSGGTSADQVARSHHHRRAGGGTAAYFSFKEAGVL